VRELVLRHDLREPERLAGQRPGGDRLGVERPLELLEREREVQDVDVTRRNRRAARDRRQSAREGAAVDHRADADAGLLQERRARAGVHLPPALLDRAVAVQLVEAGQVRHVIPPLRRTWSGSELGPPPGHRFARPRSRFDPHQ
jgi:hypothetical protein